MADKTLMFKSDAGLEVSVAQTLEPRINSLVALGGESLQETSNRLLAKNEEGNLVSNPVYSDLLNEEFCSVVRRDGDGKEIDGTFVTFATTNNEENGVVDPAKSLLVSLKDLIVWVNIPSVINADVTTVSLVGDPQCKYWGKPILLDSPSGEPAITELQWNLIYNRTVCLHKNNGESVSGKWSLDLDKIEKKTPDVLHLTADVETTSLAINLDPSKTQTIPVIFTPDNTEDQYKLILFINSYDKRPALKQFKISNSNNDPASMQFLTPWVYLTSVNDETITGGVGEGGDIKTSALATNCVKTTDAETGEVVASPVVTVIPTVAAFSSDLDSIHVPSVPPYDQNNELKNLVEGGAFTVKASVSKVGYETQIVDLKVCINAADNRDPRFAVVIPENLTLTATLVNPEANAGETACLTKHNQSDVVTVDSSLTTAISSSNISGLNGDTPVVLTSKTIVDSKLHIEQGVAEPSGWVLIKCEANNFVPQTVKLPVTLTDKRLADSDVVWNITFSSVPTVTIGNNVPGANGDAVTLTCSSQGLAGAAVATTGVVSSIKNQWGETQTLKEIVVGVVDAQQPLTSETVDVVNIEQSANKCWINITVLTLSGIVINKRVQANVIDSRD